MTATIQILLLFLAVLAIAAVIARRLNTAPSIVLVIAGVALALTPGLPTIELAPEFVLLVILPPLIYSAGVSMSWREFRFNLRPIILLAFGAVVFTTGAVAAAATAQVVNTTQPKASSEIGRRLKRNSRQLMATPAE